MILYYVLIAFLMYLVLYLCYHCYGSDNVIVISKKTIYHMRREVVHDETARNESNFDDSS